jgi:hypothetical protein
MRFVVDPDGAIRDYPDEHEHVRHAEAGLYSYRLATAEEIRELRDRINQALDAHVEVVEES